jgi:hypothetical protein
MRGCVSILSRTLVVIPMSLSVAIITITAGAIITTAIVIIMANQGTPIANLRWRRFFKGCMYTITSSLLFV